MATKDLQGDVSPSTKQTTPVPSIPMKSDSQLHREAESEDNGDC